MLCIWLLPHITDGIFWSNGIASTWLFAKKFGHFRSSQRYIGFVRTPDCDLDGTTWRGLELMTTPAILEEIRRVRHAIFDGNRK